MPWWAILLICVGVFLALVAIRKIMKSKLPIRSTLLGLLLGPACMLMIIIIYIFTIVSIPLSHLSLVISSHLGIHWVKAMLLLQMIC